LYDNSSASIAIAGGPKEGSLAMLQSQATLYGAVAPMLTHVKIVGSPRAITAPMPNQSAFSFNAMLIGYLTEEKNITFLAKTLMPFSQNVSRYMLKNKDPRITTDDMILLTLIEMLDFMKQCKLEDDLRYAESRKEKRMMDQKMKAKEAMLERWAEKNVSRFVSGLKDGLKEGGVTDLAEESRRRNKEEEEWRTRIRGN
jgi:hypothetical protein